MTFLVDANVLSEPTKLAPNAKALEWLRIHEADLVVDPIVLGELYSGILVLPRGRKRVRLEQWFANVEQIINCVEWNAATALRWARLLTDLKGKGRKMPLLDSMIAATALTHDFTVATRNVRDFAKSGVRVVNPFD